jgi:hypothetical protein
MSAMAKAGLATVALAVGCTTQEPPATPVTPSVAEQMTIDSQYMMKLFGDKSSDEGEARPVDLADPAQYRFVMNRLRAAGKTIENSPQLFASIQATRGKAVARAAGGKTISAATDTDFCAAFILNGSEATSGSSIAFNNAHPVVSCVGGASYVYADITAYNSNLDDTENLLVTTAAGEDYSGGTAFDTVTISPTFTAIAGRVNKTDSLIIADDNAGNEQITYNVIRTNLVPIPGSITLTHPVWHGIPGTGGNIEMCQLRGGANQCDYAVGLLNGSTFTGWAAPYTGIAAVKSWAPTWVGDVNNYFAFPAAAPYNSTHLYLPTEGILDAGATTTGICSIQSIQSATFTLIKSVTGGICTTTANFASSFTILNNPRRASFRAISDFVDNHLSGRPVDCSLTRIVNEAVKPSISIRVLADCGDKYPNGTPRLVTRVATMGPDSAPALPYYVYFLNSCFAEGTTIRRADGSSAAVETIKVGDKVVSDHKGTVLTVTGISHGGEDEPLVGLRDDQGHALQLTSKHPVVKASGEVVFASTLRERDKVMTDRGVASIVSVTRIPYAGQVFNLTLGTADEQLKVGKNGTTMFAGGFLVGDSAMQKEHDTPRPVAQLSRAWQRDFQNAVANKPPMKRTLR